MNPRGTPANLKPFPPGVSGNPSGRPRKITKHHEALVNRALPEAVAKKLRALGFKGKTWGAAYAFRAGVQAVLGDIPALREITDRVEGRTVQKQELTGAEGQPLFSPDARAELLEFLGVGAPAPGPREPGGVN